AFAVGRAQEVLYDLRELERARRVSPLPVYLDSPMAIQATAIYASHPEEHDRELKEMTDAAQRPFATQRISLCRTVEASKRLNDTAGPGIIIAGSGMATRGRILPHPPRLLPHTASTPPLLCY